MGGGEIQVKVTPIYFDNYKTNKIYDYITKYR